MELTHSKINTSLVVMVQAFDWSDRESRGIFAIVVNHVIGPNPLKLVALVEAQFRHCWLIPPIPFLATSGATSLDVIDSCHYLRTLTSIDLESRVACNERGMWPISLHSPTLCGPIISIPYRAVNSHGLVFRIWNPLVLQIRMYTNRRLIDQESKQKHITQTSKITVRSSLTEYTSKIDFRPN